MTDTLRRAARDAFMAMCAHRDNPDDEVFQDAIDALGLACSGVAQEEPRPPCEDYCGNRGCELFGCALTSDAAATAFDAWFDCNFLDPDGGSSHLPAWFKADMRRAWDAALSSTDRQP